VWDEQNRQRFQDLRRRELAGALSAAEQAELAHMIEELEAMEAAYLTPAIARRRGETAQLQAEAEKLEGQK